MSLSALLALGQGQRRGLCIWSRGRLPTDDPDAVETAAWLVAEEAMRYRCKGAPESFERWRAAARGERELDQREQDSVIPFIRTAFGLPGRELPDDHVQGYVAEFVWFLVVSESGSEERQLRAAKGPDFHVTGPGGDGLAIYEVADELTFCLWEIKKHDGERHVSTTVSRAYSQLDAHATEYLAQMTALGAYYPPDIAALLATLVDLWIDADRAAGAGVAVSMSDRHLPSRCFSTMQTRFPQLANDGQLRGLAVALADSPAFAERVKEIVWSAL